MKKTIRVSLVVVALGLAACSGKPILPEGAVVIEGRYFDGFERVVEKGEIVIHEGHILCAGGIGECAAVDAERIRVSGSTILPGMIDLHVHARTHYLGFFPKAGITTVRDANNDLETVVALRNLADGPRVVASGPMLDGEESVIKSMSETAAFPGEEDWQTIMPVLVRNADDARQAVKALAERGVDVIKLYEQLPPEAYFAAASEAKRHGLPVMTDLGMAGTRGLTVAQVDALQAADAGANSIEHLSGFALAYQRLGGNPESADLDSELLDRIADAFAHSGAAVVPTLANTVHFTLDERPDLSDVPMSQATEEMFGGWWKQLFDATRASVPRKEIDKRFAQALLPRLRDRGVRIGAGSDTPAAPFTVAGGGVHQELEYLVMFGLSEQEALSAATGTAGRIIGDERLGVIRAGAIADLVVVKGDPLTDIKATRDIEWVMMKGELLHSD